MPMTMASILSRPCLSGLRLRPRRLFGFDGTTDADPRSPTGSITPGAFGPAPATAPARIADPAIRDLQGPRPRDRRLSRLRRNRRALTRSRLPARLDLSRSGATAFTHFGLSGL